MWVLHPSRLKMNGNVITKSLHKIFITGECSSRFFAMGCGQGMEDFFYVRSYKQTKNTTLQAMLEDSSC